jgi:hypothetical protein
MFLFFRKLRPVPVSPSVLFEAYRWFFLKAVGGGRGIGWSMKLTNSFQC